MSEEPQKQQKEQMMSHLGMSRNPLTERMDMFQNLWRRAVLSWHLIRDPEVPVTTKAIPVLTLVYVLSPLDFLPDLVGPLGVIDDIVLIGAAFDLFVRLTPAELVLYHARELGFVVGEQQIEG